MIFILPQKCLKMMKEAVWVLDGWSSLLWKRLHVSEGVFTRLLFLWCRSCLSGCTAWRSTASRPSGGSSEERSGTSCGRGWTPAPTTWTRWGTTTGSQIIAEVQTLTAALLVVALHWNSALHHPALPAAHHRSLLPGLHAGKTAAVS